MLKSAKRQNKIFSQIKKIPSKYNVMVRLWHQLVVPRCFKALGGEALMAASKTPTPQSPTLFAFTTITITSM